MKNNNDINLSLLFLIITFLTVLLSGVFLLTGLDSVSLITITNLSYLFLTFSQLMLIKSQEGQENSE
jgi:hypothetical protein